MEHPNQQPTNTPPQQPTNTPTPSQTAQPHHSITSEHIPLELCEQDSVKQNTNEMIKNQHRTVENENEEKRLEQGEKKTQQREKNNTSEDTSLQQAQDTTVSPPSKQSQSQQPTRRHNRNTDTVEADRSTQGKPNTFAGYSIIEHSNLLRNAVVQSKNAPYTYYSSFYGAIEQGSEVEEVHSGGFREYLGMSLDAMFQSEFDKEELNSK